MKFKFTPYAWAKICYMRDVDRVEVAGYGESAEDDLATIIDFHMVEQDNAPATVSLRGDGIAGHLEGMFERGVPPERCGRIWIHTHPSNGVTPSSTDEKTFEELYDAAPWSVMLIVGTEGATSCRLKVMKPFPYIVECQTGLTWDYDFAGSDREDWAEEYERCVNKQKTTVYTGKYTSAPRYLPPYPGKEESQRQYSHRDDYFRAYDWDARYSIDSDDKGKDATQDATDLADDLELYCKDCTFVWKYDDSQYIDYCPKCNSSNVDFVEDDEPWRQWYKETFPGSNT